ncbi:MAG: DinB family protein [Adhaeribacter sp.]
MNQDQVLRDQLTSLLRGGHAFTPYTRILAGIRAETAARQLPGLPYTLWKQIEHLRISLYDILDFSRDPDYQSPDWPAGYWPAADGPGSQQEVDKSVEAIGKGVEAMVSLVQDPARDLYTPFAHGQGQHLLRQAMLMAEHNAYHLGEILVLRRLLGDWQEVA